MLIVSNLYVSVNNKDILRGITLNIKPGEVHAVMGPNGSGKSTLASVLMGNPNYQIIKGKIILDSKNITKFDPEERAKLGLFLGWQHPIAIPGVSPVNFLRAAYKHLHNADQSVSALEFFNKLKLIAKSLQLPEELLKRSLNDGLSGGERKKMETLQMLALEPKYIILDEIDTGTDVDALKVLGKAIQKLLTKEQKNPSTSLRINSRTKEPKPGILLITHYNRIFRYIKPGFVHILKNGQVVKSGDFKLVDQVEKKGYGQF